MKKIVA